MYERIADGLGMPDDARHLLGLAASRAERSGGAAFDLAAFPEVVRVYAAQNSAAGETQQQARGAEESDMLAVCGLGPTLQLASGSLETITTAGKRSQNPGNVVCFVVSV